MSIKPRSVPSLDYVKLFDSGCVKTRLDELTRGFMAKLIHDDMLKMADKARRSFKPVPMYNPGGINLSEKFGKKAREEAKKILELEREAFVKSREEKLFNKLTFIRDKLRAYMFSVDEEGKVVKATFVSRVVHGAHSYHENYASFFGTDKDRDRMKVINDLNRSLSQDAYMIPYSSEEIKALWKEIGKLITPDHYENWHDNRVIQVYGGRYAFTDRNLEGEAWLKRVKERAEKLIADRKKAS